mmetsp:Transcript_1837/g.4318  ORF Transcript_1837/g.4318 Transcript_1837/m.4318 type:complete len:87 (+) Transcript_1837:76-336(+)
MPVRLLRRWGVNDASRDEGFTMVENGDGIAYYEYGYYMIEAVALALRCHTHIYFLVCILLCTSRLRSGHVRSGLSTPASADATGTS